MPAPTAVRILRLTLTNFRSYRAASLTVDRDLVVLTGPNGAGKTNLLEAISFLAPGRGLRRATLEEAAFSEGDGSWAVAAEIEGALGLATLGTGIALPAEDFALTRQCRIDRKPVASAEEALSSNATETSLSVMRIASRSGSRLHGRSRPKPHVRRPRVGLLRAARHPRDPVDHERHAPAEPGYGRALHHHGRRSPAGRYRRRSGKEGPRGQR